MVFYLAYGDSLAKSRLGRFVFVLIPWVFRRRFDSVLHFVFSSSDSSRVHVTYALGMCASHEDYLNPDHGVHTISTMAILQATTGSLAISDNIRNTPLVGIKK